MFNFTDHCGCLQGRFLIYHIILTVRILRDISNSLVSKYPTGTCRRGYHIPHHGAGGMRLPDGYRLCCVSHSNSNRQYLPWRMVRTPQCAKESAINHWKRGTEKYDARIKTFLVASAAVSRDFKIRDATAVWRGRKYFLRRRNIAHAHAVVLMASRRVENVGLAILTFCTKREYIPFCA